MAHIRDNRSTDRNFPQWRNFMSTFPAGESLSQTFPTDTQTCPMGKFQLKLNGYKDPEKPVLLYDDTIVAGEDEVGVLLMGHELGAWWTGSRLDIEDGARSILPGHNATTMQVAVGVVGALTWMLKNPKKASTFPSTSTIMRKSLRAQCRTWNPVSRCSRIGLHSKSALHC
jgi:hypothetical protein